MRELAQALAVNPMTVSKAFQLLEAATERLALLRPTLERAAAEAQQLADPPRQAPGLFVRLLAAAATPIR